VQIELLKPHEHAGQRLNAGSVLAIDDSQGQWLIDLEVARRAKTAKPITLSVPANPTSPVSNPIEEISK
jgi:hypothetical protein